MTGQSCRIQRQGAMFIFSAPSGGGKSSLIKGLLKELDNARGTYAEFQGGLRAKSLV